MSRKISQAGIGLIKSFEGCRLRAYKPVKTEQHYTIGWGHYGPDVKAGMTITQEQADAMLIADLARYEAPVNALPFAAQLNQNQFDALVSFCYNCGAGNLKKLCANRTVDEIPNHMPKYNTGGGNVLTGLVRRRAAEVALYLKAELKPSQPVEDNIKIVVNDKLAAMGRIVEGSVYGPLRSIGEALGMAIAFDSVNRVPTVDGVAVEQYMSFSGSTYVNKKAIESVLGAKVSWDNVNKKLYIYKSVT